MIDGVEQATSRNDFAWTDIPHAECITWENRRVTGMLQAAPGVSHRRTLHHPQPGLWIVSDTIRDSEEHELVWHFHLAPDLSVRLDDESEEVWIDLDNEPFVQLVPPPEVQLSVESGWYSSRYADKQAAPVLKGTWHGSLSTDETQFDWIFQRSMSGE
jgi:hypothetical protein